MLMRWHRCRVRSRGWEGRLRVGRDCAGRQFRMARREGMTGVWARREAAGQDFGLG